MTTSLFLLFVTCFLVVCSAVPATAPGLEAFISGLGLVTNEEDVQKIAEKMVGYLLGPPIILPTPSHVDLGGGNIEYNSIIGNKSEGTTQPEYTTPPPYYTTPPPMDIDVVGDTTEVYNTWCENVEQAIDALQPFQGAAEYVHLLQRAADVAANFAQLTPNTDTFGLPANVDFPITNAGSIPLVFGKRGIHEKSFQGSVPYYGGAFVLKEFLGLKAFIRRSKVPVYQEPWFSRRRIVRWRWVYHIYYVPCEYLKSIIYSVPTYGAPVSVTIDKREVCDHTLLSYWNYPLAK